MGRVFEAHAGLLDTCRHSRRDECALLRAVAHRDAAVGVALHGELVACALPVDPESCLAFVPRIIFRAAVRRRGVIAVEVLCVNAVSAVGADRSFPS